jgi:hypothetical protein
MARGWESKSVEEQIEASKIAKTESYAAPAADPEKTRKIANLKLARAQVVRSLAAAENPRYREMLERGLAELDAHLTKLEMSASSSELE